MLYRLERPLWPKIFRLVCDAMHCQRAQQATLCHWSFYARLCFAMASGVAHQAVPETATSRSPHKCQTKAKLCCFCCRRCDDTLSDQVIPDEHAAHAGHARSMLSSSIA